MIFIQTCPLSARCPSDPLEPVLNALRNQSVQPEDAWQRYIKHLGTQSPHEPNFQKLKPEAFPAQEILLPGSLAKADASLVQIVDSLKANVLPKIPLQDLDEKATIQFAKNLKAIREAALVATLGATREPRLAQSLKTLGDTFENRIGPIEQTLNETSGDHQARMTAVQMIQDYTKQFGDNLKGAIKVPYAKNISVQIKEPNLDSVRKPSRLAAYREAALLADKEASTPKPQVKTESTLTRIEKKNPEPAEKLKGFYTERPTQQQIDALARAKKTVQNPIPESAEDSYAQELSKEWKLLREELAQDAERSGFRKETERFQNAITIAESELLEKLRNIERAKEAFNNQVQMEKATLEQLETLSETLPKNLNLNPVQEKLSAFKSLLLQAAQNHSVISTESVLSRIKEISAKRSDIIRELTPLISTESLFNKVKTISREALYNAEQTEKLVQSNLIRSDSTQNMLQRIQHLNSDFIKEIEYLASGRSRVFASDTPENRILSALYKKDKVHASRFESFLMQIPQNIASESASIGALYPGLLRATLALQKMNRVSDLSGLSHTQINSTLQELMAVRSELFTQINKANLSDTLQADLIRLEQNYNQNLVALSIKSSPDHSLEDAQDFSSTFQRLLIGQLGEIQGLLQFRGVEEIGVKLKLTLTPAKNLSKSQKLSLELSGLWSRRHKNPKNLETTILNRVPELGTLLQELQRNKKPLDISFQDWFEKKEWDMVVHRDGKTVLVETKTYPRPMTFSDLRFKKGDGHLDRTIEEQFIRMAGYRKLLMNLQPIGTPKILPPFQIGVFLPSGMDEGLRKWFLDLGFIILEV